MIVRSGFAQSGVRINSPTNGTVYLQPTNVPLSVVISVDVRNDFNLPTDLFDGTNYLAVEIHNSGPQSGDIGFDLALVADIPAAPPNLAIQRLETNVLVSWPVGYEGYRLESAVAPGSGRTGWQRATNRLTTIQGRWVQTNRTDAAMRFFRLTLD